MDLPSLVPPSGPWLRIAAAADVLGVSVSTLRRWSDTGKLLGSRTAGGQRRYRRDDLERLLGVPALLPDEPAGQSAGTPVRPLLTARGGGALALDGTGWEIPQTLQEGNVEDWRTSLEEGVDGWVVRHNEAQLVNDMLTDPRAVPIEGTDVEPQASIVVPLDVGDDVIGVLVLERVLSHLDSAR
jgi:excisionase family DNA binding protein